MDAGEEEHDVQRAAGPGTGGFRVRASRRALETVNPIRNLVQNIDVRPNPQLEKIDLSVGDPTVYGNLAPPPAALDALADAVRSGASNGYPPSFGTFAARSAVASFLNAPFATGSDAFRFTADDIFLTPGTSGALELAMAAVVERGDAVLIPQPGFPLFQTVAGNLGVRCVRYKLKPESNWEVDLDSLRAAATSEGSAAVAVVINNPSNPCGSVWRTEHLAEVVALAAELGLLVISDEVYADLVFLTSQRTFTSAASAVGQSSTASAAAGPPMMILGGISKRFAVPGWRLGWVAVADRTGVLAEANVRGALRQLTTRMLLPNRAVQDVLPVMLSAAPEHANGAAFDALLSELERNAAVCVDELSRCPALVPIAPQGAMYLLVKLDHAVLGTKLADDMAFTRALLEEEAVFVLPGQCFEAPGFVRIVFAAPERVLREALQRISRFCLRHSES